MTATRVNRRHVLVTGALAGGGLLVGCAAPSPTTRMGRPRDFPASGGQVALNGWVKITAEDQVIVAMPRAEMGQGVHTALAMLVADELDADWARVSTEAAPIAQIYANTALMLNLAPFLPDDDGFMARTARASLQRLGYSLSLQVTGGSSSVRDAWDPLRLAGATARVMLVRAAAARWQVPVAQCGATEGAVLHKPSGRKLRYGELAQAASDVSPPDEVGFKPRLAWRLIGKPVPRTDLAAKVNGQAQFGIDARPPGLLHAAIVHCPVFGGTLKAVNDQAARALRGVKDVFPLGRSAVVVVADNTWRARNAVAALQIDWDEGPHARLSSADISAQLLRDLDAHRGSSFRDEGDAQRALEGAAQKVEALYEAPFLAHAALEPVNCTAQVRDGQVTVWASTQVPSFARWRAAQVAGVDSSQVTLHLPYLGGGFGRRLETDMVEEAVAIALRTGGAPVKLTWSREEDMQHDVYRPAAMARFSAGLNAAGKPVAWINKVSAPSVSLATMERLRPILAMDIPDKNHIEGAFELPYEIAGLSVRQVRSKTPVPVGSWRSVGHSYNAFFTECFLDELAHAARQDPYLYRRALLTRRPRHRAVLDLAAGRAGWGQTPPPGRARGIALHESFASICAQVVEVSMQGGAPRVHRVVCALDCGTVVNPDTVDAQLQSAIVFGLSAALYGEITLKDGRVEQSNYPSYDTVKLASMPVIETHLVPSTAPPGGVGEPGTPPIAPALANAWFTLTGRRVRKLPLRG